MHQCILFQSYLSLFFYDNSVDYTVSIVLTGGANYDEKQDVEKQRTQERSARYIL